MNITKVVLFVFFASILTSNASLIHDFLSSAKNFWPKTKDLSVDQGFKKLPAVNFELPAENEEFIKEGLTLIGAPRESLDLCTHRVIHALKRNCNQLSLEETGKLAVMMLNCQLETEGRPTFVCKPEMTLQQCTMGMDSNMHQTYSFMTHRAIGICSALKQDQFRALSEITVNRLMQSAHAQAKSINEALKNQRRLNEMEIENIKEFSENNDKIKETQADSLEKLKQTENLIEENLLSLQQELELRQRSEGKLSEIEKSTNEISTRLVQQTTELHEGHNKLLMDVDQISASLQKNNQELIEQYHQTLEFLEKFKSVMLVLSRIASTIKSYVDKILETMQEIGFEMTDEFIAFMLLNLLYFTCGMIFMLFIDAKDHCKILLVGLFVFNNIAAYFKADIALFPVNVFIWLCFLSLKFLVAMKRRFNAIKFNVPKYMKFHRDQDSDESDQEDERNPPKRRSMTPIARLFNKSPIRPIASPIKPSVAHVNNNHQSASNIPTLAPRVNVPKISHMKTLNEDDNEMAAIFNAQQSALASVIPTPSRTDTPFDLNRPMTPAMRRVLGSTPTFPDRTGTPFQTGMAGRIQCQALTVKGLQCRNAAKPGNNKCRVHDY